MPANVAPTAIEVPTNSYRTVQPRNNTRDVRSPSLWCTYPRPPAGQVSHELETPEFLRGPIDGAKRRSREWQAEQVRRTGFVTPQAELGHAVIAALREQGYHPTVAIVGGQLAAVGTEYNWLGNARIGSIIGRSERTVQRARALLEAEGLISSHLLLYGDRLAGQRAPVRHSQVVRDVSRLQRLANVRETQRREPPRTGKRRPSAADMPPAPRDESPVDPALFSKLGEAHPEFAAFFGDMAAAAKQRRPERPPANAATVTPEEIDELDRVTAELERELERKQRERGPPERGPPRGRSD